MHLEADLHETIAWAKQQFKWAFTLSNAGSFYFEDYCDLSQLRKLDWCAIQKNNWRDCRGEKQAEFLIEKCFPWILVQRVGVYSMNICRQVHEAMRTVDHQPKIEVIQEWYY